MELVMELCGVIAVLAGIVSLIMMFLVKAEPTEKKVLIPGGICLVTLVAFVLMYVLM